MKINIKAILRVISLIILDLSAYYISLFLAVFIRTNIISILFPNFPNFAFSYSYFASMIWVPIILIVVIQFEKLYYARYPFWEETKIIIKAISISMLVVFLTLSVRNIYGHYSKLVFLLLWFFLMFFIPILRYFGKKILYKIRIWREDVLIIGTGDSGIQTARGVLNEKHLGYEILGFLSDMSDNIGKTIKILDKEYKIYGPAEKFSKYINILKIETVFISKPTLNNIELEDLINEIYRSVRKVIVIPEIKGSSIFNSELHYLFMEKLFILKVNNNLLSLTNIVIKRIFDLFLGIFGIIVSIPLFIIISILIKLTSPGPVIYKHKRIGEDGKEFYSYKFRSMYQNSEEILKKILETDEKARKEWEANFKLKNDPRVTPVGKFLRKTSLDELPQLFNILKGEMSLVGPRPIVRQELESHYNEIKDYYFSVKPGLTGLWQVSGRSDIDYERRTQIDRWYIQNWSLWLDIIIILKTFYVVLNKKGAY